MLICRLGEDDYVFIAPGESVDEGSVWDATRWQVGFE